MKRSSTRNRRLRTLGDRQLAVVGGGNMYLEEGGGGGSTSNATIFWWSPDGALWQFNGGLGIWEFGGGYR